MTRAIVVLGHGSRSPEATAQFLQVIDLLKRQQGTALVLPAFMELAEPQLQAALRQAVDAGAREVLVIPCFLFQGIHIKHDIPEMLEALTTAHPGLAVRFGRPIGPDPRIADILAERVKELQ
ncbi:MAG TPA: CbiX/SirB N-terminal domain-containing protein [Armatimonadota bacterium]|nr:CbiX/SirB N-terminal domain-containing protein [Armatimonadota bacterium]HOS44528.1 CbiX/SirB N-terminal domain-containing protein [Armatimonadota bacterium]